MTISRNLSIFAANVTSTGTYTEFASGTLMLFQQTAAPTGWTKQTTHHDKALRVVNGSVSTGGAVFFSATFANTSPTITTSGLSAGATTLSTTQIPSHTHSTIGACGIPAMVRVENGGSPGASATQTGAAGGGGSHTHSISGSATSSLIPLNVAYVDLIIASKT